MVGMAEVGHQLVWMGWQSIWHFAPENPEDGEMYLLVSAHPGCSGRSPESRKMVVCVCVCVLIYYQRSMNKNKLQVPPYLLVTISSIGTLHF